MISLKTDLNPSGYPTMNKTMKTILTTLAVALVGCGILCDQTQAAQITGDIGFFGAASASGASPGSPVTIHFTNPWSVLSGSSDYAGVPFGTSPVTFADFSFTGDGVGAALVAPKTPEWSFSFGGIDYSFDLLSLTNAHTQSASGVGSMAFTGVGTVHATGFDDTPATWSLQGSGEGFNFTLSSSTTSAVPEGGVMSLLGLGCAILAGRALIRKRKTV